MDSILSVAAEWLPDDVKTDWRRFSSGLWRLPEGEIPAADYADTSDKGLTQPWTIFQLE